MMKKRDRQRCRAWRHHQSMALETTIMSVQDDQHLATMTMMAMMWMPIRQRWHQFDSMSMAHDSSMVMMRQWHQFVSLIDVAPRTTSIVRESHRSTNSTMMARRSMRNECAAVVEDQNMMTKKQEMQVNDNRILLQWRQEDAKLKRKYMIALLEVARDEHQYAGASSMMVAHHSSTSVAYRYWCSAIVDRTASESAQLTIVHQRCCASFLMNS